MKVASSDRKILVVVVLACVFVYVARHQFSNDSPGIQNQISEQRNSANQKYDLKSWNSQYKGSSGKSSDNWRKSGSYPWNNPNRNHGDERGSNANQEDRNEWKYRVEGDGNPPWAQPKYDGNQPWEKTKGDRNPPGENNQPWGKPKEDNNPEWAKPKDDRNPPWAKPKEDRNPIWGKPKSDYDEETEKADTQGGYGNQENGWENNNPFNKKGDQGNWVDNDNNPKPEQQWHDDSTNGREGSKEREEGYWPSRKEGQKPMGNWWQRKKEERVKDQDSREFQKYFEGKVNMKGEETSFSGYSDGNGKFEGNVGGQNVFKGWYTGKTNQQIAHKEQQQNPGKQFNPKETEKNYGNLFNDNRKQYDKNWLENLANRMNDPTAPKVNSGQTGQTGSIGYESEFDVNSLFKVPKPAATDTIIKPGGDLQWDKDVDNRLTKLLKQFDPPNEKSSQPLHEKKWNGNGKKWNDNGKEWNDNGKDWKHEGKNWNDNGKDWNHDGKDWSDNGKDWNDNGKDWKHDGKDWNHSGNDWNDNGKDWNDNGNDWKHDEKDLKQDGKDWKENGKDWDYNGNDGMQYSDYTNEQGNDYRWYDDYGVPTETPNDHNGGGRQADGSAGSNEHQHMTSPDYNQQKTTTEIAIEFNISMSDAKVYSNPEEAAKAIRSYKMYKEPEDITHFYEELEAARSEGPSITVNKRTVKKKMYNLAPQVFDSVPQSFHPGMRSPCWFKEQGSPLYCLPSFFIGGFPSGGFKRLSEMIKEHPQTFQQGQTLNWWNNHRKGSPSFDDYAKVGMAGEFHGTFNNKVTFDASPRLLWDESLQMEGVNGDTKLEPNFVAADLIHAVNPKAKIIMILRDPVERQFEDYKTMAYNKITKNLRRTPPSQQEFHSFVIPDIRTYNLCLDKHSRRACAYMKDSMDLRLSLGVYAVFLRDWFRVFQKEQILLIDYNDLDTECFTVLTEVFKFLELDELDPNETKKICSKPKPKNQNIGKMLVDDDIKLKKFYATSNNELRYVIKNDYFGWSYNVLAETPRK